MATFSRSLETGVSREEFLHLLPAVVQSFEVDGETVQWLDADRVWVIRLVSLSDRRVGSVVVPRHRVEITLDECAEVEGEAFMDRLRRALLRGGG